MSAAECARATSFVLPDWLNMVRDCQELTYTSSPDVLQQAIAVKRIGYYFTVPYCASLKEYFYGVREHLIFTPDGMLAGAIQLPGNRHDANGAYLLLKTAFTGTFYADNAYTPKPSEREKLEAKGIRMCAVPKKNAKLPLAPRLDEYLRKKRAVIERYIGLFNQQFHAARTLNRAVRHYLARRTFKMLAHNCSRVVNQTLRAPIHSVAHFHAAA